MARNGVARNRYDRKGQILVEIWMGIIFPLRFDFNFGDKFPQRHMVRCVIPVIGMKYGLELVVVQRLQRSGGYHGTAPNHGTRHQQELECGDPSVFCSKSVHGHFELRKDQSKN